MLKIKLIFSVILFLAMGINSAFAESNDKGPKYPAVTEWQGQVWLTDSKGKRELLRKKQVLKLKSEIETSSLGQVKVQLDTTRSLVLGGDSQISFPSISLGDGEVTVIRFFRGTLKWHHPLESATSHNIAITSDLFEFILPQGIYTLFIDPSRAVANVKVFQGVFEFSALNGEEYARVVAGQQISFQGIMENGEIAYDVLLKGKKIPKGSLSAVVDLTNEEMKKVLKEEQAIKKIFEAHKKAEKEERHKEREKGLICKKPEGKFNQCAWVCINNSKNEKKICQLKFGAACVRRRCNANGDWSDEIQLSAEKSANFCRAQPLVGPCDY